MSNVLASFLICFGGTCRICSIFQVVSVEYEKKKNKKTQRPMMDINV